MFTPSAPPFIQPGDDPLGVKNLAAQGGFGGPDPFGAIQAGARSSFQNVLDKARKKRYEAMFINNGPNPAPIFGDRIVDDNAVSGVAEGHSGKSQSVSDLYID